MVGGQGKKKTYDLNTHADPFLNRYASSPFPEAIEANEKELAEVCIHGPMALKYFIERSYVTLCIWAYSRRSLRERQPFARVRNLPENPPPPDPLRARARISVRR